MPKVKDIDLEFIQSNRHRERERTQKNNESLEKETHKHIYMKNEKY